MLQWKFPSIADNLLRLFECESLQFPNKQKVISTPPIPCTVPLCHKSASLQLAPGTSPLAAASRYLKSWVALYQLPLAQPLVSSCLQMLSLILDLVYSIANQWDGKKTIVTRFKIGIVYWHTNKTLLEKQYPKQYCSSLWPNFLHFLAILSFSLTC